VGKRHTDFTTAVNAPIASIRCLVGPTIPLPSRGEGEYAWRFISHLGLNYLSLTDTDSTTGAGALRELLRLYVPVNSAAMLRQLEGVLSVKTDPIVRRIPGAGPICAGRGLQVVVAAGDENAVANLPGFEIQHRPKFPLGYLDQPSFLKLTHLHPGDHPSVPMVMFVDPQGMVRVELQNNDPLMKKRDLTIRSTIRELLKEPGIKP